MDHPLASPTIHSSVTEKRVIQLMKDELLTLSNPGICLECGADHDGCEPDATNYECHECRMHMVFGAAEILLTGNYHKSTDPDTEV